MTIATEERIENLLDRLEDPNLPQSEIDKIKDKVKFLQGLD